MEYFQELRGRFFSKRTILQLKNQCVFSSGEDRSSAKNPMRRITMGFYCERYENSDKQEQRPTGTTQEEKGERNSPTKTLMVPPEAEAERRVRD